MSENPRQIRILFVFAWLVVGGEETEVRLLARNLDRSRYRIDVIPCFRKPGMPEQTHRQLEALGVDVDRTPYDLSFEDTVSYLAAKISSYDIVVSCQNVADIYPALERLHWRPCLIEHGGLVSEALAGPKHFTDRYVGVCQTIRDAAAVKMPDRPTHAIEIPSMADLREFGKIDRVALRTYFGVSPSSVVVGWVGRLDRKKRVEDFIEAAALLYQKIPEIHFVIIGGPDLFMPEYEEELRGMVIEKGLSDFLTFTGDREDVPDLLSAVDIFVWLSRNEGMPHVIAEAGAAGVPVIATPDNGTIQQIDHGRTGLFVPHESPSDLAAAIELLASDPALRRQMGEALKRKVETTYSAAVVVPQWETLFEEVLRSREPAPKASLFSSFIQGGFECSTHMRRDGKRLDLILATGHDAHSANDYRQLASHRMLTARDGLRWHLIEGPSGHYDWSSFLPMLRASLAEGTQVIWDLMHYGWPDHIDIWSSSFPQCFARYARNVADIIRSESDTIPFYCPINEISFHSWAGGDVAYLNPFAQGRGVELKVQLVRASIMAMNEILNVDPRARFVHCEPVINIIHDPERPHERGQAERLRLSQFQAWDMISGQIWPQLGGTGKLLDIIGLNYYSDNQWIYGGGTIQLEHPYYKPFQKILTEVYARYGKPLAITETGAEGQLRAEWFNYVCRETEAARSVGIPVEGVCLYPIVDQVGWDDGRNCPSGLLSNEFRNGQRLVHQPLQDEMDRWHNLGLVSKERQ